MGEERRDVWKRGERRERDRGGGEESGKRDTKGQHTPEKCFCVTLVARQFCASHKRQSKAHLNNKSIRSAFHKI